MEYRFIYNYIQNKKFRVGGVTVSKCIFFGLRRNKPTTFSNSEIYYCIEI